MKNIDSDYLVIGCGAVSMAFVDTLMDEKPDATFAIIDRLHMPGGHWNHAYPFVRLHQPSALYGVATVPLGNDLSLIHISEPTDQRGSRMPSSA